MSPQTITGLLLATFGCFLSYGQQKPPNAPDFTDAPPVYFTFQQTATSGKQVVMPIDKYFTLVVTKFPLTNPKEAFLYLAEYRNGRRQLVTHMENGSLVAVPQCNVSVTASNDTLILSMPPLRPAKYFDVYIVTGLGAPALADLLKVNKFVMQNDGINGDKFFAQLVDETTDKSYPGIPFKRLRVGRNFGEYADYFDRKGLRPIYTALLARADPVAQTYPGEGSLHQIAVSLTSQKIKFDKISLFNRVLVDSSLGDILDGILPVDYQLLTKPADLFDFDGRMKNLSATINYVDSLTGVINVLILRTGSDSLKTTLAAIKSFGDALKTKFTLIKKNNQRILDFIDNDDNIRQSLMLTGNAFAPDLLTRANFLITTDLGITNIWAKDNRNNVNWLPKLFFGVNIFFRRTDKNASMKDLPWKWRESGLLSSRNPWQYVSLSLGTTIGNMNNKSFDNLYNSFSFTLGPSVRLSKAFRFTGGMALLRRVRQNPLESDKEITWGPFAAFSIDVDLLTPAKNVTSLLFK